MNNKIKVIVNGKQIFAEKGATLSEIIKGEKPCGGHGKCGKCRVIAKGNVSEPTQAELKLLSSYALAKGVRLACLTHALGNCQIITMPQAEKLQIVTDGDLPELKINPTFSSYGVAIDMGTTTLAARLYDKDATMLAEASCLNPQAEYGADVISRIEAALSGKAALLSGAIRNAINNLITELAFAADIGAKAIDRVCITGNTVMLSLLTGESVEPFSHAPFDAKRLFGETQKAEDLLLSALQPGTPVYLPPCISAFVGADTTCALLATGLCGNATAMLADIGTNGEMALWHDGKLTVCSTAAGPAFEGVGISMGMRGVTGAIDQVSIANGKITAHVIGDTAPMGICGSGLVDAVTCLLQTGQIDETGHMEEAEIPIASAVTLAQKDIRMLQLAKSAICAGVLTLLDSAGLPPQEIPRFYVAGGFGHYLNKESAGSIGLFPNALSNAMQTVGNAALSGAAMLLLDANAKTVAQGLCKNANVLDLSTSPVFSEHYMMGMLLGKQL